MATVFGSVLFPEFDPNSGQEPIVSAAPGKQAPRLRTAERHQRQMHLESLDQRLPMDHQARDIWSFVEGADLAPLYESILAVEGHAGRHATDPKILAARLALCLAQKQAAPDRGQTVQQW